MWHVWVERRGAYWGFVGKPDGKRPLGRPRRRWKCSIEINFEEVGWGGMSLIDLAQVRDSWQAVVNAVMNLWFPENAGNLLSS